MTDKNPMDNFEERMEEEARINRHERRMFFIAIGFCALFWLFSMIVLTDALVKMG